MEGQLAAQGARGEVVVVEVGRKQGEVVATRTNERQRPSLARAALRGRAEAQGERAAANE
jgi:hypothetical protein